MSLSENFKDAVDKKDMERVYSRFVEIIAIDPTGESLDEMLEYAKKRIPVLYQDHDGEIFNHNQSEWSKEYFKEQIFKLRRNFSKTRLEFCFKMIKVISADTIQIRNEQKKKYKSRKAQRILNHSQRFCGCFSRKFIIIS